MLKLSVIGNLGNDPELRYSATGSAFIRFNVAANLRIRNESGGWEDKTEWVRCTVFGARAESLANILKKGTRVYADGRLEARPWTNNQGEVKAGLELVANDVEFASSRQDGDRDQMHPTNTVNRPARQPAAASLGMDDSDLPF